MYLSHVLKCYNIFWIWDMLKIKASYFAFWNLRFPKTLNSYVTKYSKYVFSLKFFFSNYRKEAAFVVEVYIVLHACRLLHEPKKITFLVNASVLPMTGTTKSVWPSRRSAPSSTRRTANAPWERSRSFCASNMRTSSVSMTSSVHQLLTRWRMCILLQCV